MRELRQAFAAAFGLAPAIRQDDPQRTTIRNLDFLFNPGSVALVVRQVEILPGFDLDQSHWAVPEAHMPPNFKGGLWALT